MQGFKKPPEVLEKFLCVLKRVGSPELAAFMVIVSPRNPADLNVLFNISLSLIQKGQSIFMLWTIKACVTNSLKGMCSSEVLKSPCLLHLQVCHPLSFVTY